MTNNQPSSVAREDVGPGEIDRFRGISCKFTDFAMRDRFARAEGLRLSTSRNGLAAILGLTWRECRPNMLNSSTTWDDHVDVWHRGGKPVVYTSHPYGDPPPGVLESIAERFALTVEVRPPSESWYYPGSTSLVILRATEQTRALARAWVRQQ